MIIGLDVGGTHTDAVLLGQDCLLRQVKVPTDPDNLFASVWTAIEEVTKEIPPGIIKRVVLSTTLTTNAISEGKLVESGMIVSGGPGISPECFRTNSHYYIVSGAINHRGREIQPIDTQEIETVASLLHSKGIRNVGIIGKFSTRNPKHEIQIREILGSAFDYVVMGHKLSGSLGFPRRIATAYLNAAVYPVHKRFFEAVRDSLHNKRLAIPIYVLKADGGTMSFQASLELPGQTILSGPAASIIGALPFSHKGSETLVLDIGGTTTDMALLVDSTPLLDPIGIELGGYKTLIRSLKTHSIGLGGDSTVRIVEGKVIIGPDRHGPAMAYGGPSPTPTDALFVLGKVTSGNVEASRRGFLPLAEQLRITLEEAALLVFDQACHGILDAAAGMIADINSKPVYTIHELLKGYQAKPTELLVLGGPAPYFADRLAVLTDFNVRVVPQWGVANAIGAALARNTCEVTLFADTERGFALAPEEGFLQPIQGDFDATKATEMAKELLRNKCLQEGFCETLPEMEVVEHAEYNLVRNFCTTGRNIRIRVQVKPGLIPEYRVIAEKLFNACDLPAKL
ncbi:MAG: hydantoinase/oxoprolinase family protein [Syntrophobacteraceae bacterium]